MLLLYYAIIYHYHWRDKYDIEGRQDRHGAVRQLQNRLCAARGGLTAFCENGQEGRMPFGTQMP